MIYVPIFYMFIFVKSINPRVHWHIIWQMNPGFMKFIYMICLKIIVTVWGLLKYLNCLQLVRAHTPCPQTCPFLLLYTFQTNFLNPFQPFIICQFCHLCFELFSSMTYVFLQLFEMFNALMSNLNWTGFCCTLLIEICKSVCAFNV